MKLYATVVDNDDPNKGGRLKLRIALINDNVSVDDMEWIESSTGSIESSKMIPSIDDIVTIKSVDDKVGDNDRNWEWSQLDFINKKFINDFVGDDYLKSVLLFYKNLSEWGGEGTSSILWTFTEGMRFISQDALIQMRMDNSIFLKSDGLLVHVKKDHISLGSEDKSDEPAVMGDKNLDALSKLNNTTHSHWTNLHTMLAELAMVSASNAMTAALAAPITKFIASEIVIMTKDKITNKKAIDKTPSKKVSLD